MTTSHSSNKILSDYLYNYTSQSKERSIDSQDLHDPSFWKNSS